MLSAASKAFHRLNVAGASATRRLYHASVLPSLISTASPDFRTKAEAMGGLVSELEGLTAKARQGGGERAAERMRKQGKKLPRERSVRLLTHLPDTYLN